MDNLDKNLDSYNYGQNYENESRLRKAADFFWEITKIAVISLAIILPVRYFLIQPFYVKGASMEPNFFDHEYLIIDELSYRFNEPSRGDIVVFKYPQDPSQYFIKRVIGLPGENIKIKDGQVVITDKENKTFTLTEAYLSPGVSTNLFVKGYDNVTLGENEFFLMGDNREQSLDSRVFGPVKREFIVGRTWLRGWPFNRLTVFNAPDYSK